MRLKNPTTGYCVETSTDTATRHLIACGFTPVDESDAQPEKKPRARRKKTDETEQKEG